MEKLASFIRLIRPINDLMMGVAVLFSGIVALHYKFSPNLILGFVTAATLTASSMAVNDYYDREVDAINEPSKPIPSGLITPNEALIFACLLWVIGLTAAVYTNPLCLLVATGFSALALLYNTKGKATGLLGNLMVSACIAIPFIYGGLVVGNGDIKLLGIFALMAFLSNTGREITKGISDVEGDERRNVKTVAIRFGPEAAACTATIFYASAVALSIMPWILKLISNIAYVPLVLVADAGFIASSILLLKDYSRENAKRVKTLILIWMAIGLIAFLVGGQ